MQYSVQADHLHLVIEAESASVLSSGMRSFAVRVAMRVNRCVLRRRGHVWGDRYHRRDLTSPREVRHALVYVLANHLKHREPNVGLLDPLSSGPWFTGWMHARWPPPTEPPSTEAADTWLLRQGWHERGGGFIHLGERPKAVRPARTPSRPSRFGDADSPVWRELDQLAVVFSSEAGSTVMGPSSRPSSVTSRRSRVAAQYFGASSR